LFFTNADYWKQVITRALMSKVDDYDYEDDDDDDDDDGDGR
jgi:hypothetical protein